MRDRRSFHVDAVRRRVRQYLIAEAEDRRSSGSLVGPGASKVTSTGKGVAGDFFVRQQGGLESLGRIVRFSGSSRDRGLGKEEDASAAMLRFKSDLMDAEPGDVFYLTFGLAEFEALSKSDQERFSGDSEVVRYVTRTLDAIRGALLGEAPVSGAGNSSAPKLSDDVQKRIDKASSSIMTGQKMAEMGAQQIAKIQSERVSALRNLMFKIKSDGQEGLTARSAVNMIGEIIDLPPEAARAFESGDFGDGADIVIKEIAAGQSLLTTKYLAQELILLSSAQMIAVGNRIIDLSMGLTGILRTGKNLGDSEHLLDELTRSPTIRGASPETVKDVNNEAANILFGSCSSILCFDNDKLKSSKLTAAEISDRLERGGLPTSLLMCTIELLCYVITFDKEFAGSLESYEKKMSQYQLQMQRYKAEGSVGAEPEPPTASYWARHTAGTTDKLGALSAALWASHVDPEHAMQIARSFMGDGTKIEDAHAKLRRGSRASSHPDSRIDNILTVIAQKMKSGPFEKALEAFNKDQDNPNKQRALDLARAKIAAETVSAYNAKGEDTTTGEEVAKIISWRETAISVKADTIGSAPDLSPRRRKDPKTDPAEIAADAIRRHVSQEGKRFIHENVLRNLVFGATIRCIARRSDTIITKKSIDATLGKRSSVGSIREVPVFEGKIEFPKQRGISMIEDFSTLSKLISSPGAASTRRKAQGDVTETGVGKLEDPGEATRASRTRMNRAAIVTPNMRLSLSTEEILKGMADGKLAEKLLSRDSYDTDGGFFIPYIEKHTSYRQTMTPDDVISLEQVMDKELRPVNVAIQLLGAKKFHDPTSRSRRVTRAYLKPIPELGIMPSGYVPIGIDKDFADSALNALSEDAEKERISRSSGMATRAMNFTGMKSYDLTDRVLEDSNLANPLRSEAVKVIERLRKTIPKMGTTRRGRHMRRVLRGIKNDVARSHNMSSDMFETRLFTRKIHYTIESLLNEARRINSSKSDVISDRLAPVLTEGGTAFKDVNDLGRLFLDTSEAVRVTQVTSRLAKLMVSEVGVTAGNLGNVIAASAIIRAANRLTLTGDVNANARSLSDKIKEKTDDPIKTPAEGSLLPTAVPLLPAIEASKNAASQVIDLFSGIEIKQVLERINPDFAYESAILTGKDLDNLHDLDDELGDVSSADPLEITQTAATLLNHFEALRSHVSEGESGGPLEMIEKLASDIEDFAKRLNSSQFGRALITKGRVERCPTDVASIAFESSAHKGTVLSAFLSMVDAVQGTGQNFEESVEDLVSVLGTGKVRKGAAESQQASEKIQKTSRVTSIFQELLSRLERDIVDQIKTATLQAADFALKQQVSESAQLLIDFLNEHGDIEVAVSVRPDAGARIAIREFSVGNIDSLPMRISDPNGINNPALANQFKQQIIPSVRRAIGSLQTRSGASIGSTLQEIAEFMIQSLDQLPDELSEEAARFAAVTPEGKDWTSLTRDLRQSKEAVKNSSGEIKSMMSRIESDLQAELNRQASVQIPFDESARDLFRQFYERMSTERKGISGFPKEELRKITEIIRGFNKQTISLQQVKSAESKLREMTTSNIRYNPQPFEERIEGLNVDIMRTPGVDQEIKELLLEFNSKIGPSISMTSVQRVLSFAESLRLVVQESSDMVETLDAYLTEVGKGSLPDTRSELANKLPSSGKTKYTGGQAVKAKEIMKALGPVRNMIDQIDKNVLSFEMSLRQIIQKRGRTPADMLTTAINLTALDAGDLVESAETIVEALVTPKTDDGISIVEEVIENFESAFSGSLINHREKVTLAAARQRPKAYDNISGQLDARTASPIKIQKMHNERQQGLTPDQTALIACIIQGDSPIEMDDFIDPYEVARKLIRNAAKKIEDPKKTNEQIMVATPVIQRLAVVLQRAFFPAVTRKGMEDINLQELKGEIVTLPPRNASLSARTESIYQGVSIAKKRAKQEDLVFFETIAAYLASINVRIAEEPTLRASDVPTSRVKKAFSSTARGQIELARTMDKELANVPTIRAAAEPSAVVGVTQDAPRAGYASAASRLRDFVAKHGDMTADTASGPVAIRDLSVTDAIEALNRGGVPDELAGDLSSMLPGIRDTLVDLGGMPDRRKQTPGSDKKVPLMADFEQLPAVTSLEEAPVEITRLLKLAFPDIKKP
jgi:hypothetical protein